jgi:chemotaxis-related protein WspB
MLFLVFQLGTDRYAIEAEQVVEVLPLVKPKHIPRAPPGVAGVFDYHGAPVPLIDLAELALGKSSRKWMSTRIILVNYREKSGKVHLVGILAEHTTETMRRPKEDFKDAGVMVAESPYLGPVITEAAGIIQRIGIQNLLSESVGDYLFREQVESL